MTTLSDLIALLTRCPVDSPAMLRLPEGERTVEGIAKAYLPPHLFIYRACGDGRVFIDTPDMFWRGMLAADVLHVETVGIGHALLVALALALGLDPGVGGLGVRWTRHDLGDEEWWCLPGPGAEYWAFTSTTMYTTARSIHAPTVAAEPDPIKALSLAVRHVLETP